MDKVDCLNELQWLETQGYVDLFYGDESGFSLNCVIPYCWQFPDEPITILPQRGKTLNTLGFMNTAGNQVQTFTKTGTMDAAFVLHAVDTFAATLTKLTVLVLDNARIHHAKIFQAAMPQWEAQGLYIFFLPPYSPHLNRIETLWRQVKYRWIKPNDYQNLDTLKLALDNIWKSFGTQYAINFKIENLK